MWYKGQKYNAAGVYCRMPKRFLLFLFTIVFSGVALAQSPSAVRSYRKGIEARMQGDWDKAMMHFQRATRKSPDYTAAWIQLGEVYGDKGDCHASLNAYAKASVFSPRQGLFSMGRQGLDCGLYHRADSALTAYITLPNAPSKFVADAKRWQANCQFAISELRKSNLKDIKDLGDSVNQLDASYFPAVSGNGRMVIYTARNLEDGQTHEDIWLAILQEDGTWKSNRLPGYVNSGGNEGAVTTSGSLSRIVFTACDRTAGVGSCDLYMAARLPDGSYHHPRLLNQEINTPQWESQPSLSADGQWLYFIRASHQQGDRAGNIYRAHWNGREYTDVEKLSNVINTPYREATPSIHPNGRTLFFASEGHVGMGALDLFRTELQPDGTWSEPVNLGNGINSHLDDFGIGVHPNGKIAYISRGDLGEIDQSYSSGKIRLYEVDLNQAVEPIHWLEMIAVDAQTKDAIHHASWRRYSVDAQRSEPLEVTKQSMIELPLYAGEIVGLNVVARGYQMMSIQKEIPPSTDFQVVRDTVFLHRITKGESFIVRNLLFDFDQATLRAASVHEIKALVGFLQENPGVNILIEGHTDNQGSEAYNQRLSVDRAESVQQAVTRAGIDASRIRIKGLGSSQPASSNQTEEGRQRNRRTVIRIL